MASPVLDPTLTLPTELKNLRFKPNIKRIELKNSTISVFQKCSSLKQLKQIHARILRTYSFVDHFTLSKLISSSTISEFRNLDYATSIFEQTDRPNIFLWNTMIRAYSATSALSGKTIFLFSRMQEEQDLKPDKHTFTFVLRACAQNRSLCEGEQIHGVVLKFGFESDNYIHSSLIGLYAACSRIELARLVYDKMPCQGLVSSTALIDGYVKAGRINSAREVFDGLRQKDKILWTAMISGYAKSDQPEEALQLFQLMVREVGAVACESVIPSVLSACARLGALETGKWLHRFLNRHRIKLTTRMATALVDMYAKCGLIDVAVQMFDKILQPDVVAWNAMISGLALQGNGQGALGLLQRMERAGTRPNESTFVAVLTACAHSGMVDEGKLKFEQMRTKYKIEPKMDHYGCMVDMLARSGCVEEAEEFIKTMPIRPDGVIWRSFLDGCRGQNDVARAELAMAKLMELGCCESTDFVILANIYASLNRYVEAGKVRRLMKDREIEKQAGCSSIEVEGGVHGFIAGDKSHPRSDEIYSILSELMEVMLWGEADSNAASTFPDFSCR
ncbi:pentatricopeptide repeat-containing protein At5g66520-like isoform X1 [Tasmannia lanceolata]|uniref:pentatricopeptide repeat-containing protein At5g66520-like isoform X1 n=1 Tax=Tasmannia lanceolata TaxID=3420 RepID=UPI0040630DBB